ncbi:YajQ family cyclic di-GMP-binding protein [Aliikangiella sp. IMCC44653]
MPSLDVVSEVDFHELANAVDQANREISTRFDLKNTSAKFELKDTQVKVIADGKMHVKQLVDMLRVKLIKRGIDPQCMEIGDIKANGKLVYQEVVIREGIEQSLAKKISKLIKDSKLKVQASIQGDKLRVTGKKRDDLQAVMRLIKESELEWPMQFNNFRD